MYARPLRQGAVLLLVGQLISCTSWHAENLAPAPFITNHRPDKVRLQLSNGHQEVLYEPDILGDTLFGHRHQDWNPTRPDRAIPVANVTGVATSHFSAARTITLGVSLAVLAGLVVSAAEHAIPSITLGPL